MATVINAENFTPEQRRVMQALLAETTALRAALAVLLPKLDADAGVTDTNYTALCTPAAAQVS